MNLGDAQAALGNAANWFAVGLGWLLLAGIALLVVGVVVFGAYALIAVLREDREVERIRARRLAEGGE